VVKSQARDLAVAKDKTPSDRLRSSVRSLEKLTGRRTFVFVRPFDHLVADQIEAEIGRALGEDPKPKSLDVVLDSDGGSADAAYKAVLILRGISTDLRVLVPQWAKSAATLFALGADAISMRAAHAELGPLDAQVTDPRNPARTMSALDGYQSVEYLRDYALTTQGLAVRQTMNATQARVPLNEIIAQSESFAVDVISPIMSRVKPLDFGGWGRTLDIGKVYAERLLARFGMAGADPRMVRATANELVYGYPHHGFVIDNDEAESLGLNIQAMDTDLYRATQAVVRDAAHCTTRVCDEGAHGPDSGYCGFAPEETNGKDGKEAQNGAKATLDSELETHSEAQHA
jgi:hypothetical protein